MNKIQYCHLKKYPKTYKKTYPLRLSIYWLRFAGILHTCYHVFQIFILLVWDNLPILSYLWALNTNYGHNALSLPMSKIIQWTETPQPTLPNRYIDLVPRLIVFEPNRYTFICKDFWNSFLKFKFKQPNSKDTFLFIYFDMNY